MSESMVPSATSPGPGVDERCGPGPWLSDLRCIFDAMLEEADVDALSVKDALELARGAVRQAAPGLLWVVGQVEELFRSNGNVYWDLVGERCRLPVAAFGPDAEHIESVLAEAGVKLEDGAEVRVQGFLGVYAAKGRVQLKARTVDPSVTVGVAELARRRLLGELEAAGAAAGQAMLSLPAAPMAVALVAPAGDGRADFVRALERSGWAFSVRELTVVSEGERACEQLSQAIAAAGAGPADVVVVARGGGSGVTRAYDAAEVAWAVARCQRPVLMAVGHSTDVSVADQMAWRSVSTPTAAGEFLAEMVGEADRVLVEEARAVHQACRAVLADASRVLEAEHSAVGAGLFQARQAAAARAASRRAWLVAAALALALLVVLVVVFR